ncbi:MAG: flavin reductase family protein, partial [Planctomycetes bacterium]|nr:flavin reductase family protein [Planctomycetota bacterium]
MSKTQIEPYRPVYPSPAALITTISEDGTPNIVTLGECFNISIARPPIVGIAIRKVTYSYDLICRTPEFAINLPTTDIIEQVDGIGCVSGSECNKFERFDLTPV